MTKKTLIHNQVKDKPTNSKTKTIRILFLALLFHIKVSFVYNVSHDTYLCDSVYNFLNIWNMGGKKVLMRNAQLGK